MGLVKGYARYCIRAVTNVVLKYFLTYYNNLAVEITWDAPDCEGILTMLRYQDGDGEEFEVMLESHECCQCFFEDEHEFLFHPSFCGFCLTHCGSVGRYHNIESLDGHPLAGQVENRPISQVVP